MVQPNEQLLAGIQAYAAELERRGVPVERVIMFGSQVTGHARADSDIDLAVFSERFDDHDHLEFSGVLSAAKWTTDPRIEPIGFHPRSLHNVPPASFLREILSTGRVVYERHR